MAAPLLRRSLCFVLLTLVFVAPLGCNDDDGVRTVSFRVDLTVLTPDDQPVEGVEVHLHVPIPGFAPSKATAARRARAVTQVEAPVPARQILEIYDLEGRLVRRLFDGTVLAGVHQFSFDGRNNAGDELLGTHVLDFRFTARDAENGALLFEDRYWATLFTGFDLEKTHRLGVTDARGKLRVTDRSLFPGLYELPEMTSTDETGQQTGTFAFGQEVEFVVRDPAVSGYSVNPRSVAPGANELSLRSVPPLPQPGSEVATVDTGARVQPSTDAIPIDPPTEWAFRQNFPNPFN